MTMFGDLEDGGVLAYEIAGFWLLSLVAEIISHRKLQLCANWGTRLLATSEREQSHPLNCLKGMWLWASGGRAESLHRRPLPLLCPAPHPWPLFNSEIALIKTVPECSQTALLYCRPHSLPRPAASSAAMHPEPLTRDYFSRGFSVPAGSGWGRLEGTLGPRSACPLGSLPRWAGK